MSLLKECCICQLVQHNKWVSSWKQLLCVAFLKSTVKPGGSEDLAKKWLNLMGSISCIFNHMRGQLRPGCSRMALAEVILFYVVSRFQQTSSCLSPGLQKSVRSIYFPLPYKTIETEAGTWPRITPTRFCGSKITRIQGVRGQLHLRKGATESHHK